MINLPVTFEDYGAGLEIVDASGRTIATVALLASGSIPSEEEIEIAETIVDALNIYAKR